jgi:hypothetical protein
VRNVVPFLFATCGALLLAASATATPIGPTCDGGSCQGGVYALTYDGTALPSPPADPNTYRITFAMDLFAYTGGGTGVESVAIKVSSSFLSASLVSAPEGAGNWEEVPGGLNGNGCSGSGSGFFCVKVKSGGTVPSIVTGNPAHPLLSWVFDIQVASADDLKLTDSSVKARFVNSSGSKVGDLLSEDIHLQDEPFPPVPEPSPGLLLAASGLLGLAIKGSPKRGRS